MYFFLVRISTEVVYFPIFIGYMIEVSLIRFGAFLILMALFFFVVQSFVVHFEVYERFFSQRMRGRNGKPDQEPTIGLFSSLSRSITSVLQRPSKGASSVSQTLRRRTVREENQKPRELGKEEREERAKRSWADSFAPTPEALDSHLRKWQVTIEQKNLFHSTFILHSHLVVASSFARQSCTHILAVESQPSVNG